MFPITLATDTTNSWLAVHWTAAGIVSAAARFVPIPFVDEKIQRRCRRYVVEKTLASSESQLTIEDLEPLYDPSGSILAAIFRVPTKLLLFPVRKLAKIVTSIRGVPIEVLNVYLLGRTLHRYLSPETKLEAKSAESFQKVFDKAFRQIDLRIARAAISDVLASISEWKSGAQETAAEVHREQRLQPSDAQISKVEESAQKVSQTLDQPETQLVFQRFDARFDRLFSSS